nr:MAG TPA: hypothetical protein [Caudoviricetes sp.]
MQTNKVKKYGLLGIHKLKNIVSNQPHSSSPYCSPN